MSGKGRWGAPVSAVSRLLMALLVVMVTIGGFALPVAADQSLRIVSPKDGATVTGPDITVTVDAGSLHLVPAGDAKSLNDEHIHYLLDVDPAPYLDGKRDIPFGDPHIIHTADLTHTFKDVPPGQHQVTVILTYANHIATQPAVAPTIHFTVSGGMAWEALAKLPTARYAMGVATLNGKVYAIGGSDGSDPMNTVEAYDPTTNTWAVKAPMPTPRLDLGVAVAGGKIYAIGGFDGNQRLASVEAYDPTTNTWSARASLPTARSALGVATGADGKIYAIGGCSGNECNRLATVEAYDPQSNSWTARAPLPAARSGLAVVGAPNGELYAIGGCTGSLCDRVATVDAYNPATNSWAAKSSLPSPRDAFGAALGANGKIYVVGGSNTGKSLADVLQYDPTIDTWTPMTSLPTARSGLSLAATPDGKLLAIGGIGSGGLVELATAPGPLLPAPAEVASAAQPGAFPYLPVGVGIVVIGALGAGAAAMTRRRPLAPAQPGPGVPAGPGPLVGGKSGASASAIRRQDVSGTTPAPEASGTEATVIAGAPNVPTGYVIEGEPRYGGMAVVYRAFQPALDRRVALKILLPHLASDPSFVERFYREARRTAKLEHPNIVPIYDLGQLPDGAAYIAMRYIDGPTLQEVLQREGALAVERACGIAIAVADALDYAHRLGIIHRDVKPSNILVESGDRITLTDFGIAKLLGPESEGGDSNLTRVGAVVGTPKYLSPEQALGQATDARSDLYSLGIVLYEMLVGRPPFEGNTTTAILKAHITTPPPAPAELGVAIPEAVQIVALKLLEKEPEDRFQTAREFIVALRRASNDTLR